MPTPYERNDVHRRVVITIQGQFVPLDSDGRACTYAALVHTTLTVGVFRDLDKAEAWLTAHAKAPEKGEA